MVFAAILSGASQVSHFHPSGHYGCASACAFTTTDRTLAHSRAARGNCAPQCPFLLHARLFRGVTPDRHAGETSLAVVHNWLAHSGYPLDLDTERNPRTAAAHVPYAVLQLLPVFSPHQARWYSWSSHTTKKEIKMSQTPIDMVTLARRIEALENAFTVTLHSISTALPSVKSDVVENLNRHAQAYEGKDSYIVSTSRALVQRIESLNPTVKG